MDETTTDHVLLIHGLAGSRAVMWPLGWHIKRAGFQSSTFSYASFSSSIERHANQLDMQLTTLENDPEVGSFHIVSHSMGCIVTRQTLLNRRFNKLRRIVMLAPPNQGSPAAALLSYLLPFSKTVRQLSNRESSFVRQLAEPLDVEVGIITGSYDLVIPEPNSHLDNEADHTTLFSGHNGLLVRPTAARHVIRFLNFGRF